MLQVGELAEAFMTEAKNVWEGAQQADLSNYWEYDPLQASNGWELVRVEDRDHSQSTGGASMSRAWSEPEHDKILEALLQKDGMRSPDSDEAAARAWLKTPEPEEPVGGQSGEGPTSGGVERLSLSAQHEYSLRAGAVVPSWAVKSTPPRAEVHTDDEDGEADTEGEPDMRCRIWGVVGLGGVVIWGPDEPAAVEKVGSTRTGRNAETTAARAAPARCPPQ